MKAVIIKYHCPLCKKLGVPENKCSGVLGFGFDGNMYCSFGGHHVEKNSSEWIEVMNNLDDYERAEIKKMLEQN